MLGFFSISKDNLINVIWTKEQNSNKTSCKVFSFSKQDLKKNLIYCLLATINPLLGLIQKIIYLSRFVGQYAYVISPACDVYMKVLHWISLVSIK